MPIKSVIAADTTSLSTQIFFDELDRLMGSAIGVIAIRTREVMRAQMLLHQWASLRVMEFAVWDCVNGTQNYRALPVKAVNGTTPTLAFENEDQMREFLEPKDKVNGSESMLNALDIYAIRHHDKSNMNNKLCGVFIGIIPEMLNEPMVQGHIRDTFRRGLIVDDRLILLLTPGTIVPDAVSGDVETIDLNPPTFAELREHFVEMEDQIPEDFGFEPDDDDRNTMAQNGLGMTMQGYENALTLAIVDNSARIERAGLDKPVITTTDFVRVLRGRKLEMLKSTNALELMREADIGQVGGLDLLKIDLEIQKRAFSAEARQFGILPPKGLMVIGPPGSGKTLVAETISAMFGIPGVRVDLSAFLGGVVGSTEAKTRAVLKMLEDMAPCVAFIDEMDKALGGSGDLDGGVTKRLLGTLLTWMQDRQTKGIPVYIVGSANNVKSLPAELLRKGRFDDLWSVGFPVRVEREMIFRIHVEKRGHKLTKDEYAQAARLTHNYAGSEIEAAVEAALRMDFFADNEQITLSSLEECIKNITPQAKAFPERVREMQEWCERNARPSSSFKDDDYEEPKAPVAGLKPKPVIKRPVSGFKKG